MINYSSFFLRLLIATFQYCFFQILPVNLSFLDSLQDFCKDKISRQIERYGSKENLYLLCQQEDEEKNKTSEVVLEAPVVQTSLEESPRKKKKINFHRVQVNMISSQS